MTNSNKKTAAAEPEAPEEEPVAPAPAPEISDDLPAPASAKGPVVFLCERWPGLIIAPGGRTLATFTNGRLETDNPRVIDVCRGIEEVSEEQ